MPAFSTSLSGLDSASQELSVIGNNLANLNTTGFKDQTVNFQDLFYQQLGSAGSGDPIQIGVGVGAGSISSNMTNGSVQSTGVASDVAIQGNGYFVLQGSGGPEYTRAGNFQVNAQGQLIASNGAVVLGYPAVNGVVNANAAPTAMTVAGGTVSPPNATSTVQLNMNLDSTTATNGTYSTSVSVYDSLGTSHILTYNFTKTASNAWNYAITVPATDVGQTGAPVKVTSGTLSFDTSGNLTSPSADVTGLSIPSLADGAATLKFDWNLLQNGSPVVTQVASSSATASTNQDGYASGSLTSYNVLSDGTIEGVFSNGQNAALGQIAIADFANDQGLSRNGGGTYAATLASGAANIGVAGSAGRGTLAGGSLELSNVDIATEFSNLILAERAFQANAKAITTLDQVGQVTVSMKT
jgi:flagellar hook protein FlgE